jgi:hypothetical protein
MKTKVLILSLFAFLPAALFAAGDTTYDPIAAVKNDLFWRDAHPLSNLNYVITEGSGGRLYMYRVSRVGDNQMRYTLLRVDGRPSWESEVTDFSKKWNCYDLKNAKPGSARAWINYENPLRIMDPESLVKEKEDGNVIIFRFACVASVGGSEPAKLDGRLYFDRAQGYVTSIDIHGTGPIKTAKGRVGEFTMHVYYELNRTLGFVVPTSADWSVRGDKVSDDCSLAIGDYRKGN